MAGVCRGVPHHSMLENGGWRGAGNWSGVEVGRERVRSGRRLGRGERWRL